MSRPKPEYKLNDAVVFAGGRGVVVSSRYREDQDLYEYLVAQYTGGTKVLRENQLSKKI